MFSSSIVSTKLAFLGAKILEFTVNVPSYIQGLQDYRSIPVLEGFAVFYTLIAFLTNLLLQIISAIKYLLIN